MLLDQVVEGQEQSLCSVQRLLRWRDDAEDHLGDIAAGEHQVELALGFLLRHQLPVDVDVRLLFQPLGEAVVVEVGDFRVVGVEEAEGDRLGRQRRDRCRISESGVGM